jgi:uncharacterized glyoxalase superfamily protein PhnB
VNNPQHPGDEVDAPARITGDRLGDEYGALEDQFGIQWMIDVTPPQG